MTLRAYRKKRDFRVTPEPRGEARGSKSGLRYVVQKHDATRLHYDFRLEWGGTLKSWAVPKGPSLDPSVKALAVEVEDHPLEYQSFEGRIPDGNYGAGNVIVWDEGTWTPIDEPAAAFKKGRIKFELHGEKLNGVWNLVRMRDGNESRANWLLIKHADEFARPKTQYDVLEAEPESVISGRPLVARERPVSRVRARPPSGGRIARRREGLPGFSPQLATPVEQPPEGSEWIHETKFDGYRVICRKSGETVRLFTRRGQDWTARFTSIARQLQTLPVRDAILDGEVVVLSESGASDFQRLQNAMKSGTASHLKYYVFDLPWCDGQDLQAEPLVERKRRLHKILRSNARKHPDVLYSEHVQSKGREMLALACRQGLEGLISKRAESQYEQRRSRNWLKSKCRCGQEFVIGGYTQPAGSRTAFGALLLGYHEPSGGLRYCGRVGSGFDERTLTSLNKRLKPLEQKVAPFQNPPMGSAARGVGWVRPQLVADVTYREATRDHQLRQPVFHGLREDKAAADVEWETQVGRPAHGPAAANGRQRQLAPRSHGSNGTVRPEMTHPSKNLFPAIGLTKAGLADYYEAVSKFILPHVANRPLMLIRCPDGVEGVRFVQKHWTATLPKAIGKVDIREKDGTKPCIVVHDVAGLIALAQISAIEIHPWGSSVAAVEKPDRLIFDLDPGPDVRWERVADGALAVRAELKRAGLASFVKTSGGKGLHVVVPLQPRANWETAKDFSRAIAERVAQASPGEFVTIMTKSRRAGRIFIDYHRNGRGATCVAPLSLRARGAAPVSAPVAWSALRKLGAGDAVTIIQVAKNPGRFAAPWKNFRSLRQSLTLERTRIGGTDSKA